MAVTWTDEAIQALLATGGDMAKMQAAFPGKGEENLRRRYIEYTQRTTTEDKDRWAAIGKIADLLKQNGVESDMIGSLDKVRFNKWQSMYKDADGEAHVVDMEGASLIISPSWDTGPQWPVVQPAKPVNISAIEVTAHQRNGFKRAVILPDPQIGFGRDIASGDLLYPFHDVAAMDVALQIAADLQPDEIVNVGDFLDFAEFGRWQLQKSFVNTVQPTIDAGYRFLAMQRAIIPRGKITVLEGNHDMRLQTYIMQNAMAAFGLRKGAATPESWPVLTVPNLLRFDELDVHYAVGYPRSEHWINHNLKVIHGWESKSRGFGATTRSVVENARESVIQGHSHRLEMAAKTVWDHGKIKQYKAVCAGCLCRIDGAVPAKGSAYDLMNRPVLTHQNWQQGLCVVEYQQGDGDFTIELVDIFVDKRGKDRRWARYRGKTYVSSSRRWL